MTDLKTCRQWSARFHYRPRLGRKNWAKANRQPPVTKCQQCRIILPSTGLSRSVRTRKFCPVRCMNLSRGINPVTTQYRQRTDARSANIVQLTASEIMHHRNGNKLDNRIENLEVMTMEEHSRADMMGNRHPARA